MNDTLNIFNHPTLCAQLMAAHMSEGFSRLEKMSAELVAYGAQGKLDNLT